VSDADDALPALAVSGSGADGAHFHAAVRTAGGVAAASAPPDRRGDLATLVQQTLRTAGVAPAAVRELLVDRGPGSYVGLRVAITFARTWCAFGGARLRSVDTLSLVAAAALAGAPELGERRLVPVLAGQQDRVHFAALRRGRDGALVASSPPALLPLAQLRETLGRDDVLIAAPALMPMLAPLAAAAGACAHAVAAVGAEHLFSPALAPEHADPVALEPLYLMGSYVAAPGGAAD
jgi:tRNA A37 threonylcarbamoyladenosine modification protein TsaB